MARKGFCNSSGRVQGLRDVVVPGHLKDKPEFSGDILIGGQQHREFQVPSTKFLRFKVRGQDVSIRKGKRLSSVPHLNQVLQENFGSKAGAVVENGKIFITLSPDDRRQFDMRSSAMSNHTNMRIEYRDPDSMAT